jgi:hypothetical protein
MEQLASTTEIQLPGRGGVITLFAGHYDVVTEAVSACMLRYPVQGYGTSVQDVRWTCGEQVVVSVWRGVSCD